jgi:hypothetical protein
LESALKSFARNDKTGWDAMSETHEAAERRSLAAKQARIGCCACAEDLNVLRVTRHYFPCRAHDSELKEFEASKLGFVFVSAFQSREAALRSLVNVSRGIAFWITDEADTEESRFFFLSRDGVL